MRIGIHVGHWEGQPHDLIALALEAERAGMDSVWTSETWGSDALLTLTWIAARTERIGLGLGGSGPQVAEGWHGVPFDHPLERTREYVAIVRSVLRRDAPVTAPGPHFPLPLPGGPGKPLKTNVRPLRTEVPIFLAAMGPANVALAAEIAEGWIPFLYSPEKAGVFEEAIAEGRRARGRGMAALEVAPMVPTAIGEDLAACRDALRPLLALYAGGMGSRRGDFYHALATRYRDGQAAAAIRDAFL